MKVKVVSAFIPLDVKHLSAEQYHAYGARLREACGGRLRVFEHPLEECWVAKEYALDALEPATATPLDRYATFREHVRSHVVQHNRTTWAMKAMEEDRSAEVCVWLDYGILKQGGWNGRPLTEDHVSQFIARLEGLDVLDHIPFPGIEPMSQVQPFGNNWRFCGSTHVWPKQFLSTIHQGYKYHLREFIKRFGRIPLDLAIWPLVEFSSNLPFRWYKAEYDHTQLTGLPL